MAEYQYDITAHSKIIENHIHHLKEVFQRCRLYEIFINPKKCVFVVSERNLLGRTVNTEGIYIDPSRVKAINELNPLT
jgi:hypothetical protein